MININELPSTAHADEAPVFVLSLERSGSTLCRNILDAHPAIFSPAQLYMGDLCYWMYLASYSSISQISIDLSDQERKVAAAADVRRTVSGMMQHYASKKEKSIWCDKTTMNINHIDILGKIFPDAKFICLYRNCLDFVYSYMSVSRLGFMEEIAPYIKINPYNVVSAIADYWVDKNSVIYGFEEENTAKCFRVTYEEIVSSPNETLSSLFGFLGLEWGNELFDRVFQSKGKGPVEGDIKFQFSKKLSTDSIGQGKKLPLTSIPERQLKRLNELLVKLGYPAISAQLNTHGIKKTEVGAVSDTKEDQPLRELFASYFPKLIAERLGSFRALNCVCKLLVSGKGGGSWTFDLTKPEGSVYPGDGEAICTIGVSSEVLKAIVNGEITALEAFQEGLIGASGDQRMATNFGRLLFG